MFKNLLRELNDLNGQIIGIKIPVDEKGYLDRKCPNSECGKKFKINFEDWKNIVRDEAVFCPVCKNEAPSTEWNTAEQQEYINNQGISHIQDTFSKAIQKDAKHFNKQQKPGFINISLSYKPGNKIIPIPPAVAKELEQNYECNICMCRYSFLGTAYFCPSCGNENIQGNLKEGISNIENFINKHSEIKQALKKVLSEENSESYFSQIIEEHYCKIVSIFQKHAEYLFNNYPGSDKVKIRKNLFQNLYESSAKWKELTGKSYEDILDSQQYNKVKEHFQIRHLLAHTAGIIDEDFINKTNNNSYIVGKRIIITIEKLNDFLVLIKGFISAMNKEFRKKGVRSTFDPC
ncbi:MAG: hypothetical protein L6263_01590 [Desulfobacteraceae bacterium]|nr:hypothetical protein [Desulfobacteraceae bacterium]